MDTLTKLEFVVSMTCNSCVNTVRKVLSDSEKIAETKINLENQQVVVKTSLSPEEVQSLIEEKTGMQAALVGIGSTLGKGHLGAAIVELRGSVVKGIIRMLQLTNDLCLIDGTVDGLTPGKHGLNVHSFGDLSDGCDSCGDHYNPHGSRHGGQKSNERHAGDLGNIEADAEGRARFRFTDKLIKVYDIIGRSMVIHEKEDDFTFPDGNSGRGVACAIVARSAGLFQNPKRFCTCDGVSIWEERNVPDSGRKPSQL